MKTGLDIFVTVILVAGGILAYHMLVVAPAHAPEQEQGLAIDAGAEDEVDVLVSAGDSDPSIERPALEAGDEKLARANVVRIAKLERALARALRVLQRGGSGGGSTPGDPLPPFSQFDLVNPNDPVFDDGTLDTLTAYLDEIERRKRAAKQRVRIGQNLVALGLTVSEEQRNAVADITERVQRLADDLSRRNVAPGEAGLAERRAALKDLQEEYTTALARIVPAAEAQKILNSRIARRMGFPGRKKAEPSDPRNRDD